MHRRVADRWIGTGPPGVPRRPRARAGAHLLMVNARVLPSPSAAFLVVSESTVALWLTFLPRDSPKSRPIFRERLSWGGGGGGGEEGQGTRRFGKAAGGMESDQRERDLRALFHTGKRTCKPLGYGWHMANHSRHPLPTPSQNKHTLRNTATSSSLPSTTTDFCSL